MIICGLFATSREGPSPTHSPRASIAVNSPRSTSALPSSELLCIVGWSLPSRSGHLPVRFSPFPPATFRARIDRARELMRREKIDALAIIALEHLYYFGGYDCWVGVNSPQAMILTSGGDEPTLLVRNVDIPLARETTFLADIRTYHLVNDDFAGIVRIGAGGKGRQERPRRHRVAELCGHLRARQGPRRPACPAGDRRHDDAARGAAHSQGAGRDRIDRAGRPPRRAGTTGTSLAGAAGRQRNRRLGGDRGGGQGIGQRLLVDPGRTRLRLPHRRWPCHGARKADRGRRSVACRIRRRRRPLPRDRDYKPSPLANHRSAPATSIASGWNRSTPGLLQIKVGAAGRRCRRGLAGAVAATKGSSTRR